MRVQTIMHLLIYFANASKELKEQLLEGHNLLTSRGEIGKKYLSSLLLSLSGTDREDAVSLFHLEA